MVREEEPISRSLLKREAMLCTQIFTIKFGLRIQRSAYQFCLDSVPRQIPRLHNHLSICTRHIFPPIASTLSRISLFQYLPFFIQHQHLHNSHAHVVRHPNAYWVGKGPIPPPFPNGKGASRLMDMTIFQVSVLLDEGLSFSPLGDRERRAKQRQYPSVASGRRERGLVICQNI